MNGKRTSPVLAAAVRRSLTPLLLALFVILVPSAGSALAAPCDPPVTSEIACENSKPGNPASEWDVSGSGDANIQGFTTDISVDQGGTVQFKIDSVTSLYRLDIYRMGYYGGSGARRVATVRPLSVTPQQPACLTQPASGLNDCGNWAVSATWNVPVDAVSGIYFAKLVREDGSGGASHVVFVVRDDDGGSEVLFQTSDTTWQAYNQYGGDSLYVGGPGSNPGRAYKVSYNRPFTTRGYAPEDWVFNAEYPMVRWLERNGYDVSYTTGVDTHRRGAELLEHETFLSVGHDEYWSAGQRTNVEAARSAGVNLGFFSGNEVFWKTRWEPSIDPSGSANRTLVTYKETHADAKIDPAGSSTWTGTWRDPRFSPPADGGRPENALTGQLFMVNAGATTAIRVPAADGRMRFWRDTNIATLGSGQEAVLTDGTLGYEWDEDPDNGFRPPGSVRLSSTTVTGAPVLTDYGSDFGNGTATHHMTLYKAQSGALVFGAGTVQWPWGLDQNHDRGNDPADSRMQQATTNLLADMGAQPATLQAGLTPASASTDSAAPTSNITFPSNGAQLQGGQQITITGTATDAGGGQVGAVEVSVDGGTTWHLANGRGSWTYNWTPTGSGSWNIRSRAADDSGNRETPSGGVSGGGTPQTCPCSLWNTSTVPANETEPTDNNAVEVGIKFRPIVDGRITGLRFYKGATNTGTHVGHLWSRSGTMLAEATFTNESARGWQEVTLASPVNVTAGTTYVASYHAPNGHYAWNRNYFTSGGFDSGPLRGLGDGEDGGNGVYAYGPSRTFPNNTYQSENYWVDVVFDTGSAGPDTTPPTVTSTAPASGATGVSTGANVSATFSEPMLAGSISATTFELRGPGGGLVTAGVSYDGGSRTATLDPASALAADTQYTATVKGGSGGARDAAGNALAVDRTWTFRTAQAPPPGGGCPCSIWDSSVLPANETEPTDNSAVEVGVKFRPQADGRITALRFYKGTTNTGTHVGHLWSRTGTMLAEATFTGETPRGWQEVALSNPVDVTAGTTYVASYHAPNGHYAWNRNFFTSTGVTNGPLRALAQGEDGGNGVYAYGPSRTFPNNTYQSENYWVDVVFQQGPSAPDTTPPTVTSVAPANGATGVGVDADVTAIFSEAMTASTVNSGTVELRGPGGALVSAAVAYDAASRTVTLNPAGALAGNTAYTATIKSGASGVKDSAGNALASDRVWSFTTTTPPPADTTPPTVTAISPAADATGIPLDANVTATFSEAMTASTINGGTVELRGPGGALVNAAVSYDGSTRTVTLNPASVLAASAQYTATVRSGASGVKDAAGNPLANDRTWSFTTAASAPSSSFSIWDASVVPANPAQTGDSQPVELGVKFRPQNDGRITALRFYKGATNTGTHVGHLWSNSGNMLAEATFTNETATGWQEVDLASPVDVTAGTTYVASYHAPNGNYAWNASYFANSGVDNGPLTAPSSAEANGNGVYAYGPSRSFPDNSWQATNYWIDVVFQQQSGPADTTPPTITTLAPANGAGSVAAGTNVTASFNEAMSAASVTGSSFELRGPGGALVPASVSYDGGARAAVLDPNADLAASTTYTATVKGGASGVKDTAGNALANDRTWSFTTAAPPPAPPDEGPGGPILAITKASNPFTRYYTEILRNEGLNEYLAKDISTVTPAVLANHDVAVLGDMSLTAAQVSMLTDWVNAGGNLIAMRPDKQLAGLLGLLDASATLSEGYLKVDTSGAPGSGIVDQTIQYHGGADRYVTNGATTVATLYANASTATSNPAVTVRNVGANGGQAAAFTFDLARSVVYTRQGNPAWSGDERDGLAPLRSDDLFFGGSEPHWVDLGKVAIPQADEMQRLFANLIGQVTADKKPLPRFWYFPRGEKAVVVMTGDDHSNNGTQGRFERYKELSPAGCSVANWECIRSSSYLWTNTPLSNTAAAGFEADGFELGLHLNTGCSDWDSRAELEQMYDEQLDQFREDLPSLPPQTTHRTHCIAWGDWATQPKVELERGIRLDTNYYYWPPDWVTNVPGMFTGSGMPMRFADLDGSTIDVYQAVTQMTDESGQSYPFTSDTLLDRALGAQGYYGAFTANMHTDLDNIPESEAIIESALERGVPVVSGEQLLTWLDGRNASSFGSIAWSDNTLTFTVNAATGSNGLRGMLPMRFGGRTLTSITRGGSGVSFTTETIKGVEYAIFAATSGGYSAVYGTGTPPPGDTTPPTISGVSATANVNGTATVSWTTNEASSTRVDYGSSAGSLNLNSSNPAQVTAHSVQLTGLTPGATYHYRVSSSDAAGNSAQSPAPPAAPATFSVPQTVNQAPSATTIETGSAAGGTFSSLSADDNTFFAVNGSGILTRTSSWYGSFSAVPNSLSGLRVTYSGRNTASATQTVHVWNWTTSAWVQLDSRTVSTTEIALNNLDPPGNDADYVSNSSGNGEVRIRVRATRTGTFASNGDLLRITFQR